MSVQQPLDLTDLAPLPPPALEEAPDDLSALDLLRHFRELLGQALDFGGQAWSDRDPGPAEHGEDHQVHDHDRQQPVSDHPALREPDQGKQQVREEQRNRGEEQHVSQDISQSEDADDHQNGPGCSSRASIEENPGHRD